LRLIILQIPTRDVVGETVLVIIDTRRAITLCMIEPLVICIVRMRRIHKGVDQ
jgi:hypothetical protein